MMVTLVDTLDFPKYTSDTFIGFFLSIRKVKRTLCRQRVPDFSFPLNLKSLKSIESNRSKDFPAKSEVSPLLLPQIEKPRRS